MSSSESPLRVIASEAAAAVLEEALAESRKRAAEILASRLTPLLVEEAEKLAAPGGDEGWYLYGITLESAARSLPATTGIGGRPAEVLAVGEVAAVISAVPPGLGWGLNGAGEADLETLAPRVREHERLLEDLLERGPVLPMCFGRMYPGKADVEHLLASHSSALNSSLERLVGRAEWGLMLEWQAPAPSETSPVNGHQYLAQRRQLQDSLDLAQEQACLAAEEIHQSLLPLVADSVVHRQSRRPRCLLNASYLVADEQLASFRQTAATSLSSAPEHLGMTAELTGPWPAYHFADLELEGAVP